jgi:carbonic anhydrase
MDQSHVFTECFTEDHNQYKKIFEGNQEWVQERLHEDTHYFSKLSKGQTPKYLIIGCSDSRVPPNDLTKLKPGDIFNHRNIANQVLPADMNVNSVIQYAVEHLKVKHVVVMGHTHCGGKI